MRGRLLKTTTRNEITAILEQASRRQLIDDDDTLTVFLDIAILNDRMERVKNCFPSNSLHAIPIKTNPLTCALQHVVSSGQGLEAASLGEIYLALNAGAKPEKIVFDSPAKTAREIALLRNLCPSMRLNADSLEELQLYSKRNSGFQLGLRINPLVESGTLPSMNVSKAHSKFGVPLTDRRLVIEACCQWQDIDCLHLHIGSQVPSIEPMIKATDRVLALADQINQTAGFNKIQTIDIGGGFPVNYHQGAHYHIEHYAEALKERCPGLFSGQYQLITEFGRYIYANSAWAATTAQYVKKRPGHQLLITHVGADMLLRECYAPGDWHHEITLLDDNYIQKISNLVNSDIAGPLCFGGDVIDKGLTLATACSGDTIVIHDVGANTFALWSRHCSRPFPKVLTYNSAQTDYKLHIAKDREAYSKIVDFWT